LERRMPRAGFHFEDNRIRNGAGGNIIMHNLTEKGAMPLAAWQFHVPFIRFGQTNIFVLSPEVPLKFPKPDIKIQYLLVRQNPRHNPEKVLSTLLPSKIILDTSNHRFTIQHWKEAGKNAGVEYWPVPEKGAYTAQLQRAHRTNDKIKTTSTGTNRVSTTP